MLIENKVSKVLFKKMKQHQKFLLFLLLLCLKVFLIECHGRLIEPPARSSAWRENPFIYPKYYDDNSMNCGGYTIQWRYNGASILLTS
jgi:hypothetical protein